MKKDIHPKYYPDCKVKCSCGAEFLTGATVPEMQIEVCSMCHPLYTGQKKLVDTAGRVDKFRARLAKREELAKKLKGKSKK